MSEISAKDLRRDFRDKQIVFADEFSKVHHGDADLLRRQIIAFTAWEFVGRSSSSSSSSDIQWKSDYEHRLYEDVVRAARLYCIAKREGLRAAMLHKLSQP